MEELRAKYLYSLNLAYCEGTLVLSGDKEVAFIPAARCVIRYCRRDAGSYLCDGGGKKEICVACEVVSYLGGCRQNKGGHSCISSSFRIRNGSLKWPWRSQRIRACIFVLLGEKGFNCMLCSCSFDGKKDLRLT